MELIKELTSFLNDERVDLKREACTILLKLTGTNDGLKLILHEKDLLLSIVRLIDHSDVDVAKNSLKILVNFSTEENGAHTLVTLPKVNIIARVIQCIQNPLYPYADFACGILNNVTRFANICPIVLEYINKCPLRLEVLISILCQLKYNQKGASLDHLASVISNFTLTQEGRKDLLNREEKNFERLLSFIDASSKIRRRAVIYAIHNCTFEKDYHEWFLSDSIDLSTRLVFPLAGSDVFSIEENESLPDVLQFLPVDKCREEDKGLRALLLESLMQLCTTKTCREHLRKENIYLILREHHKWETDNKCIVLNEDLVNILIRTEEEIGEADLSAVEVPSDIAQKFIDLDEELLNTETE